MWGGGATGGGRGCDTYLEAEPHIGKRGRTNVRLQDRKGGTACWVNSDGVLPKERTSNATMDGRRSGNVKGEQITPKKLGERKWSATKCRGSHGSRTIGFRIRPSTKTASCL